MEKKIEEALIEGYGWLKVAEVSYSELTSFKSGTREEFLVETTVKVSEKLPAKFTKLMMRIRGLESVLLTRYFLEKVFTELHFSIEIGDKTQTFSIVKEGSSNRKEMVVMGEMKDWVSCLFTGWRSVETDFQHGEEVKVKLWGVLGKKTEKLPDFSLGFFLKKE